MCLKRALDKAHAGSLLKRVAPPGPQHTPHREETDHGVRYGSRSQLAHGDSEKNLSTPRPAGTQEVDDPLPEDLGSPEIGTTTFAHGRGTPLYARHAAGSSNPDLAQEHNSQGTEIIA